MLAFLSGIGWECKGCCCENHRMLCELFEARSICRLDKTFLSLTEITTLNIRTILPSNFSRFSLLSSTVIKEWYRLTQRSRVSSVDK